MRMPPEQISGEAIGLELRDEAKRRGVHVIELARLLWPDGPMEKLEQVELALNPLPSTIARIRAVIDGKPVDPPKSYHTLNRGEREALGFPPSRNSELARRNLANHLAKRLEDEARLNLSRLAVQQRRAGETLQAAMRRIEQELQHG